jgi:hypothetical protein
MNFPMPPKGCTNEAVKKIISCMNEASENLPDWKDLAYKGVADVSPYFGDEEELPDNATVNVIIMDDGSGQANEEEER